MPFKYIKLDVFDNIYTITIDSPSNFNKLTIELMDEIVNAMNKANNDDECRVIILAAKGEYFCSGGELGDYRIKSSIEIRKFGTSLCNVYASITNTNKIVIASVQGDALGGGMSLVEACDLCISSENAKFGMPEVNSGLAPMIAFIGAIQILNKKDAMELALTGDSISAEKAKSIGLINYICKKDELENNTIKIAHKITQNNPSAISLCKALYNDTNNLNYDSKLRYATNMLVSMLKSSDANEALTAKIEGRKPMWKNI